MSSCFLSAVITSVHVVPSALAQGVTVKFLTIENVKRAVILKNLRVQFGDETFSKKAEQRLKTCGDYTFCTESYGQRFLELSIYFIHRFSDRTMNHQRILLFETS
jgi:hypothetical protein